MSVFIDLVDDDDDEPIPAPSRAKGQQKQKQKRRRAKWDDDDDDDDDDEFEAVIVSVNGKSIPPPEKKAKKQKAIDLSADDDEAEVIAAVVRFQKEEEEKQAAETEACASASAAATMEEKEEEEEEDQSIDPETRALLKQIREEEKAELRRRHEEDEAANLAFIKQEQEARQLELESIEYSCGICLSTDVKLADMLTLSCEPKGHMFCSECFGGYCGSKINDAEVGSGELVCPEVGCQTPISIHELKAHVSAEQFEKYERFVLKKFAEENSSNMRTCPTCNEWFAEVPQGPQNEGVWKTVECEGCKHKFCGRCGMEPHKGQKDGNSTCEEFAKWKQENATVDEAFEKYMATAALGQCPKCDVLAEGIVGNCKFTYCRCGQRFCFICGVGLEEKNHYTHFQGGPGCTGPFGNGCLGPADPAVPQPPALGSRAKAAAVAGPVVRNLPDHARPAAAAAAADAFPALLHRPFAPKGRAKVAKVRRR
jgi:hypothetical protein